MGLREAVSPHWAQNKEKQWEGRSFHFYFISMSQWV